MFNRKTIRHSAGFTLIEIIISFAIVGIVAVMLYSVFNYNLTSFSKSTNTYDEQAALRLSAYRLTNELRNIGYINLYTNTTTFTDVASLAAVHATDQFIFLNTDVIKKGSVPVGISAISEAQITSLSFSLSQNGRKYSLGITLTGKLGTTYTTEVLLNNIITNTSIQMDSSDLGNSGYVSIRYNNQRLLPDGTVITP